MVTLAGFVPCAVSAVMITFRSGSPRSANAAHDHQAGELALRACGRLERDGRQPRHLGEDSLELPHQLERTLDPVLLLQRMEVAEAGRPTTRSLTRGLCFIVQLPSG